MVPGLLGLVGATGSGPGRRPALRVLTYPFLALAILVLGRAWYLECTHPGRWRSPWRKRALTVLASSTIVSGVLWGLRFGGLLGPQPF